MRRSWFLFALVFAQACNCAPKPRVNSTHGIVVLSVNGAAVTEQDTGLSFGQACLAASGVEASVEPFFIQNSGQNVLAIRSITLSGANASSFSIVSRTPESVAAGDQAEVDVAFSPSQTGNLSATIAIDTDDPDAPEVKLHLTGTGSVKAAEATYVTACNESDGGATANPSCSALDFPDTQVGATSTQTLHITNDGCPTLLITGLAFEGSFPDGGAAFHLHDPAPTTANPISLQTGESAALKVDFAPQSINDAYGDLYVTTNGVAGPDESRSAPSGPLPDDVAYVALNGTALQPSVTLTPSSCKFSLDAGGNNCQPVLVGAGPDLSAQFLLNNAGNVDVQVTSVTVPADDAGVFSVQLPNPTPFTLDASGGPGSHALITVVYHPFNGFVGEDLVVATGAGTLSSHLIAGNPAVIVVPSQVDFNDVTGDPESFASPRDLPVQNGGTNDLVVSSYDFTQEVDFPDGGFGEGPCAYPTDAGPQPRFVVVTPAATAFPLTVAPGDTSTWSIAHQPDPSIGGSVECALHIASNDPGTPVADVRVLASTFVNCDPQAVITPDNLSTPGGITLSASVDGGAYPIDGAASFDTSATTSPSCPNGQSNGLKLFHWTLTGVTQGFAYRSHLESPAATATCLATNTAGDCIDLRITQTNVFTPDAPTVNLLLDPNDVGNPQTLSLTVTDATGRVSGTDALSINTIN